MEFEMKEYLIKINGAYKLCNLLEDDVTDEYIEIPEGCNIITCQNRMGSLVYFHWKSLDSDEFFLKDEKIWSNNFNETLSDFVEKNEGDVKIIWKRSESPNDKLASAEQYRQAEVLPFIDDDFAESDAWIESNVEQGSIEQTLAQRQSQYGSFVGVANTTGQLMGILLNSKNGYTLPYAHQEALHMICSKMARIVNGDFNHKDSWHDIGGYARLIEDEIFDETEMPF